MRGDGLADAGSIQWPAEIDERLASEPCIEVTPEREADPDPDPGPEPEKLSRRKREVMSSAYDGNIMD